MAELVAIPAAQWVVSKALSPLSDGLVEAWAASSLLAPNIKAVKTELLYAQAFLNKARGREIDNPALSELLQKLRCLAYDADDVLDELGYFRIQDELEGTFETVDRGSLHDLIRDARHTTKAVTKKLAGCTMCFSPSSKQEHGGGTDEEESRKTVRSIGKRISSLPPVHDDACTRICITPWKKQIPKTPKLDFDRVDISRKMRDIAEQLKSLCAKVSTILDLELRDISKDATTSRPIITISESTEPKMFGRESEKATIIQYITKDAHSHENLAVLHENLIVLPIVGPGGIGKTTLTQDIYNNKEVQAHFQIRVWICVSLDFNVYRLTKEILNSIPKLEGEKDENQLNLDQLQKLIQKRLENKRFLVVLDDIWKKNIDEEWKKLLIPFTKGQVKGNTILVTTRFVDVAEMVKNVEAVTQIKALDPEEFWNFFMACVFGLHKTKHPLEENVLIPIGKQIVEKLKGNPLAAKTVGKLLRNNPTPNHWKRVLQSREWDSQTSDYDIMPALKLSYDYLPFHLQQCFSYCALFPEDYEFNSEELIHFWIGLDILRPGHPRKTIEDLGLDYLNDLINYGFFKKETIERYTWTNTYYVMHDLLHDLALKVSSQECLHIDSSSATPIEIPPSIYHLSIRFNPANNDDGTIKKELPKIGNRLKYENLHTLMIFGKYDESFIVTLSEMFKDAQSLRVVRLPIMPHPKMDSIFHNFSKLLHLRYLKLESNKWSKHFPTSLSRFYHLRVLDIQECHGAIDLPKDMVNLSKLRHFLVRDVSFHSNISNVGKLQCLQELREFKVKKETDGFELRELGEMADLKALSIHNLEDVQVNEVHEAKLQDKKNLHKLALNWSANRSSKDPDIENQILEILQPHNNLCELEITWHGGSACPTWLSTNLSIKDLEALRLDGVDWKMLPPLGELWLIDESNGEYLGCARDQNFRNLKRLELTGLHNFRKWIAKDIFSLMEVLIVKDCKELTELPFSYYTYCQSEGNEATLTMFPRLREIQINKCPKLVSLPPIPYTQALHSVRIEDVGTSSLKKIYYQHDAASSYLNIEGNNDVNGLDGKVLAFHNLTQLQKLGIRCCSPLADRHLRMLTSLKSLYINCSSVKFNPLENISDSEWHLSVEELTITDWRASGKELTQLLCHLPKLSSLFLQKCDKLIGLCGAAEQRQTTAVVELEDNPQQQVATTRNWHVSWKKLIWPWCHLPKMSSLYRWECDKIAVEQQQVAEDQREEEKIVTQLCVDQEDEDGLLLLPANLSDSLRELVIEECPELILALPTSHEEEIGRHGLQALHSLHKLKIWNCSKFLSAYRTSSSCFPFPPSLKVLDIRYGCTDGMVTWKFVSNLSSLTQLYIDEVDLTCEGLWPLLTQGQLSTLSVGDAPKLFFASLDPILEGLQEEQLLLLKRSFKLRELHTEDIAGFLVKPICSFLSSSLTTLYFGFNENKEDEQVERFTKEQEEAFQLLTSLQFLEFSYSGNLQCLPAGLHRLTNLKTLRLILCPYIQSLPKGGLPSSLQELDVSNCYKLQCLPAGLHRLTNLKTLRIQNCASILSLPKGGLPSSLQELFVWRCGDEKLMQQCSKLMGTIPDITLYN